MDFEPKIGECSPIASPCVQCKTSGGTRIFGEKKPRRTKGFCMKCYRMKFPSVVKACTTCGTMGGEKRSGGLTFRADGKCLTCFKASRPCIACSSLGGKYLSPLGVPARYYGYCSYCWAIYRPEVLDLIHEPREAYIDPAELAARIEMMRSIKYPPPEMAATEIFATETWKKAYFRVEKRLGMGRRKRKAKADQLSAVGIKPAAPCVSCDTTVGKLNPNKTFHARKKGLCMRCYGKSIYQNSTRKVLANSLARTSAAASVQVSGEDAA